MSKLKKIIIVSVCAAVAVIAAGLFGIYKYFVTPDRILQLTLINAKEDIERAFYVFDEDEVEIIEDMAEDGGRIETEFTTENIPFTDKMNFNITTVSDKSRCVSEIDTGDFSLAVYKDDNTCLINTPLFNGGFEIPIRDFAAQWNQSIFKDITTVSEDIGTLDLVTGAIMGYAKNSQPEIKKAFIEILRDISEKNSVEKTGKAAVMVGSETKNASVYTVKIDKTDSERFLTDIAAELVISGLNSGAEKSNAIKGYFKGLADDYTLTFKATGTELREFEIKNSSDETVTFAFKGERNPFDIISFYRDGNTQDAFRITNTSNRQTSVIAADKNGTELFKLENNPTSTKISLTSDIMAVEAVGYDKAVYDDSITFGKASITINDTYKLSGTLTLSENRGRSVDFEKSGQYINILDISEEEWGIITESLFSQNGLTQ